MSDSLHRSHGKVFVGRVIVVVSCFLVLGANGSLFKEAATPPPLPVLKGIAIISLFWIFAGAWGMCRRKAWARFLALTILYMGSLGYFLAVIITLSMADGVLVGRLQSFYIATAVYVIVSLVLTNSKHVQRLTSRAWE